MEILGGMNLIEKFNISALEDDMQQYVAEYFINHTFDREYDHWRGRKAKVYREVTIPGIGRRSDVIVRLTDRKIFNIECKINDIGGVMAQAIDHLKWADYSYICVHARTYIPTYEIREMLTHGIGLMLWDKDILIDVFGASPNTIKKGIKRPELRKKMITILQGKDALITANSQKQLELL